MLDNNARQNNYAVITKIKRFALDDGPGIRATIFFKGCPLRCMWCSNPETQHMGIELVCFHRECNACGRCLRACPYHAISAAEDTKRIMIRSEICRNNCLLSTRTSTQLPCVDSCYAGAIRPIGEGIDLDSLTAIVMRDRLIYDLTRGGITASGGEPTTQWRFVSRLFEKCRQYGIRTALDTCGYAEWRVLDKITDNVDLVHYDIKCINSEVHRKYTGADNEVILRNARLLNRKAAQDRFQVVVRVPIVPGITDSEENVIGIADFVKSEMSGVRCVRLLPYHRLGIGAYETLGRRYGLPHIVPPSEERMSVLRNLFRKQNPTISEVDN